MKMVSGLSVIILLVVGCFLKHPTPPNNSGPITLLWSSDSYQFIGTTIEASPFPIGDSLVVMSAGSHIVLHDQKTGGVLWEAFVDSGTNLQTNEFVTDGTRLFATHARDVRAWSINTGEQLWIAEFPNDGGTFAPDEIVYYEGHVIVGGWHDAYSLDAGTGEVTWRRRIGDSTAVNDISLYQDRLFVGTGGGKPKGIYVLDASTGDSLDRYILNNGIGKVVMAPVIEDSILYVGTSWIRPFAVEAWNLNTHELLWHTQKTNSIYVCDQGKVIDNLFVCALAPFGLGAWDTQTGEERWIDIPTQSIDWGNNIGYDGSWIYYCHGRKIHVIEPETGDIVYSTRGPNGENIYQLTVANDRIFVHSLPTNLCLTTYQP